jgi:DNA-binding transcriptional LysR family regulator
MELRQLEYFVHVSELRNFTRAAQDLNVAQPSVSTQIQQLERELGQPLLDRSQRVVALTAAGEAALPHARAALAAAHNVARAVDETARLVRGTVRIGTVMSPNVGIPKLLKRFNAQHPAVEIILRTAASDALIDAVRTGKLDLAVVAIGPDDQPDGIAITPLSDELIGAAVSRTHRLAARATITLQAIQNHPLIVLPTGTEIRRQFDLACRRAGLVPRITFEVSTPSELAELAAQGLGVAIMRQSLSGSRSDLHGLSIRPALRARFALACRDAGPLSPAARTLIEMARQFTIPHEKQ